MALTLPLKRPQMQRVKNCMKKRELLPGSWTTLGRFMLTLVSAIKSFTFVQARILSAKASNSLKNWKMVW